MLPGHWPRWLVIPIALVMVAATIGVGLVLEDVTQAFAPTVAPTPTLVILPYAAPLSGGCVDCHTDKDRLLEELFDESELQRLYIKPEDVMSLHGRLGCVTCHRGDGEAGDLKASHVGLVPNPSTYEEAATYCLPCHHSVRSDISEHYIHTPHKRILRGIHENEEVCSCSNCHLAVAHDDKVLDSHSRLRSYCIDCHEERNVPPERLKCSGCHISPHDVSDGLDCDICHTSTDIWSKTQLAIHPVPLNGVHGEQHCFDCHDYPNFRTIAGYSCVDCHTKPHTFGSDDCAQCHFDDQPWNHVKELRYVEDFQHPEPWQQNMGYHADVSCQGCHFQGYEGLSTDCESCHVSMTET
jgi:hypothetical protein